jgi:tetratricopeptide (TPR) repeat protein
MDADRWNRVALVFHQALECPPAERAALLESACAGDPDLRDEVEAMLAADSTGTGLLLERAVPEPLVTGHRLGAYQVERLIAEGGMGEVYLARRADGAYHQKVAIKVLRPGYQTAEAVRRFRLERQVLARLVHPDIAPLLDGGTAPDGRPYLVLQFVEGLPLTQYVAKEALPRAARIQLLSRVARVVQYAHSLLIVHRDLKPSNIFVLPDGSPRLLDFGIAKLLDPEDDEVTAHATRPETRILTPEHAAPEQLRREPVTTAADVYALGILLYEVLTGRRPFVAKGQSPASLEREILEVDPPPPSAMPVDPRDRRALRGDLDRITLMALRKEPARRYGSAGEFADDLDRHLAGLPVRAERDTFGYRARKFAARNRGWLLAAMTSLVLLVGFVGNLIWQNRRVGQARDRAQAERLAAEDLLSILTDLFQQSNPEVVPGGDTLRVGAFLDRAEQGIGALEELERQAQMRRVLGNVWAARGQYEHAALLLRQSLAFVDSARGPSDPLGARIYFELAQVVTNHEGSEVGRAMLDTALVRLRATLGERDPQVALALAKLALVTTDLRVSLARLDSAIQLQHLVQGTDSIAIAGGLDAEGHAFLSRGRPVEALAAFEGSLRILERVVAKDHPYRLTEINNISATLSALGQWNRAESLARVVLAVDLRDDSASAAIGWDTHRVALLLANQGRLAEAESALREALARLRIHLGANHVMLLSIERDRAVVVAAQGRVAEGLAIVDSLYREASARQKTPTAGIEFFNLHRAKMLLRLRRQAEAEAAVGRAAPVILEQTPADHPYRSQLLFVQGLLALGRGDAPEAEDRFSTIREARRNAGTSPESAAPDCGLGIALARQARKEEARPLLERCSFYFKWGLAEPVLLRWYRELGDRGGA